MVLVATVFPILWCGCWRNSDRPDVRLFAAAPAWGNTTMEEVRSGHITISQQ
jgi:hypothetical protein